MTRRSGYIVALYLTLSVTVVCTFLCFKVNVNADALAVFALLVILLVMGKSWVEPFISLAATGMAVVINMGTNAFLESVSITTNSIAAVLQLALSIDYSVILMNRYRQEGDINEALHKSRPAILSSALTTVTGLLMLCFMNLKIGADLGLVLAKGVLCSLVCACTALPGLILLFDNCIDSPIFFFNVTASGFGGASVLYLAYLIVQSILMGATIDYGILFTSYYREHRSLQEGIPRLHCHNTYLRPHNDLCPRGDGVAAQRRYDPSDCAEPFSWSSLRSGDDTLRDAGSDLSDKTQ